MNKDQVLHVSNFKDYTHSQIVEMLRVLQMEVKTLRHSRDYEIENLRDLIQKLESKNQQQLTEIEKLRTFSQTYLKLLEKPLTIKERLLGKKII